MEQSEILVSLFHQVIGIKRNKTICFELAENAVQEHDSSSDHPHFACQLWRFWRC